MLNQDKMKKIFAILLVLFTTTILTSAAQQRVFAPQLATPLDGANMEAPDVILNWNAVTGGNTGMIEYDIQLDTEMDFNNPAEFHTVLLSGVQMNELMFGQTYYWRVRAIDGSDISDWSEVWSFVVLLRPVLDKPNDASNEKTDVELEWEEVSGITYYDFQFDTLYFWNSVASGTEAELFGVSVVDENNAWAVGDGGLILYYDGNMWLEQESGTSDNLSAVFFLNDSEGWAVGEDGTVLFYNGTEWTDIESNTTKDLYDVFFINATGWASGKSGEIIMYDGVEWAESSSGTSDDLFAIFFADESNGWAAGEDGGIVYFNGTEWSDQDSELSKDIYSLGFIDVNNGWAAGKSGVVTQYLDGVWTELAESPVNKDIYGMSFMGNSGIAVGKSGTMMSFDGSSWAEMGSGTDVNLNSISMGANSSGFTVGEDGVTQAYSDNAFNSPLSYIDELAPDTVPKVRTTGYLFGKTYAWRLRVRHNLDTSEWSIPRTFTIVETPEQTGPSNGSTETDLILNLKWKKVTDEVANAEYLAQVDDDPDFNIPLTFVTMEKEVEVSGFDFGVLYYWRVRASNEFDISIWSETWSFETAATVTLLSPENGETAVGIKPEITWEPIDGVTEYQFQLAKNANFNNTIEDINYSSEITSITPTVDLEEDTEYFWRVKAINHDYESEWAEAFSFTTLDNLGIDDPVNELAFSVYPNPATNNIVVELNSNTLSDYNMSILDLVGKEILSEQISAGKGTNTHKINVSELSKGIYFIRIENGSSSYVQKLTINR